jgi:hypothetical protein
LTAEAGGRAIASVVSTSVRNVSSLNFPRVTAIARSRSSHGIESTAAAKRRSSRGLPLLADDKCFELVELLLRRVGAREVQGAFEIVDDWRRDDPPVAAADQTRPGV